MTIKKILIKFNYNIKIIIIIVLISSVNELPVIGNSGLFNYKTGKSQTGFLILRQSLDAVSPIYFGLFDFWKKNFSDYYFDIGGNDFSVNDWSGAPSELSDPVSYKFVGTCPPAIPVKVIASGNSVCKGSSVTLSASVNNSADAIYWYSGSCGETYVGSSKSGSSIIVTPDITTTYYARGHTTNSNCFSQTCSEGVTIKVIQKPGKVTVNGGGTYCNNGTLQANGGIGGKIYWQGTTSGGTSTKTPSKIQSVTESGTYYFRANNSCWWGDQDSARVTILYSPGEVIVTGGGEITVGASDTLIATGGEGAIIYWQGLTINGTSTKTPSTSKIVNSAGTYYFRALNSCGWGNQAGVTVKVK